MTDSDDDVDLHDKTDEDDESPVGIGSRGKASEVVSPSKAESDGEDEAALKQRREANIRALINNSLEVCRKPVLSKILSVQEAQAVLRKPFRTPQPGAPSCSDALKRKLMARRKFVAWGDSKPFIAPLPAQLVAQQAAAQEAPEAPLPEGIEPLVLWEPGAAGGDAVVVDTMLTTFLRPHQREGVQFMFECVMGLRLPDARGCILADDMGLGKTLQAISLMWTLLRGGNEALGGNPLAKRAIIVCPTSLVSNWDSECGKWLKGRVRTLPLCESSREDVISSVAQFLHPSNVFQVLIISYETFRLHSERFKAPSSCDLLICDEAHRLKNDSTLTNRALDSLECKRRVLLSGTPMQNDLDEFYAMVDFCNPGVLGAHSEFRKRFESPILASREPGATDLEVARGEERSTELSSIVNHFILRRTNKLLSAHLPPKVVEVVCCRMTPLQRSLYCHFLESNAARRLLSGAKAAGVLSAITSLKKLCNHPKLIYDAIHSKVGGDLPEGFEGVDQLFPFGVFDNGRPGRGGLAMGWELLSGKMAVAARMLHVLHTETDDRIVIVSNYTQTLDLFATLCRERSYPYLRLDGSTSITKRQKLVTAFNDPAQKQFVFLLSSKAGGCGLNLIGGNRLILFDPDWNPATDKQAAARVWRDGQVKRVFVYRFLTTGTIEEKVFQRQVSKEGLQSLVSTQTGKATSNLMSAEALRDLFSLRPHTMSDTYDSMADAADDDAGGGDPDAPRDPLAVGRGVHREQIGAPAEEDIKNWGQHSAVATVPDPVMHKAAGEEVSFVFTCQVEGMKVVEPTGPVTPHNRRGGMMPLPGSRSTPRPPSNQRHSAPLHSTTPRPTIAPRQAASIALHPRQTPAQGTPRLANSHPAAPTPPPRSARTPTPQPRPSGPMPTPPARPAAPTPNPPRPIPTPPTHLHSTPPNSTTPLTPNPTLQAPHPALPNPTTSQPSSPPTSHPIPTSIPPSGPPLPYLPNVTSRLSSQKRPLQQLDPNVGSEPSRPAVAAGPLPPQGEENSAHATSQKRSRLSVSSNAAAKARVTQQPLAAPLAGAVAGRLVIGDDDDFM